MVYKRFQNMVLKRSKSFGPGGLERKVSIESHTQHSDDGSCESLAGQRQPLLLRIGGGKMYREIAATFNEMVIEDEDLVVFFRGLSPDIVSLHQKDFSPWHSQSFLKITTYKTP